MTEKRLSQLIACHCSMICNIAQYDRIDAVINPMGIIPDRGAHSHPSFAQAPGINKPHGHRFRDCFEAPPSWVFVGADMVGLEGCGFAHYVTPPDGVTYATALLSGDTHRARAKELGFVCKHEVRDKQNKRHVIQS